MKLIATFALALFACASFAQEMKYDCRPENTLKKPISAGGERIVSIEKLTTTMGDKISAPVFVLSGKFISQEQIANRRGNDKLVPENFENSFILNDVRSGMVLDLKAQDNNNNFITFLYTILSMKSFDVTTAGPIPEGTFNQKVDLILISDAAQVNTINLSCKVEIKY